MIQIAHADPVKETITTLDVPPASVNELYGWGVNYGQFNSSKTSL